MGKEFPWKHVDIWPFWPWGGAMVRRNDGRLVWRYCASGIMRRKTPSGKYEYREMTREESEKFVIETADRVM